LRVFLRTPALTLVVEAAGAASVVADPAMPELAAKAVPATSVVAMSAAANVLNMVFSVVFSSARRLQDRADFREHHYARRTECSLKWRSR